ncbi:Serpentine Receptor, class H [Caenorhabditis elegans]|uniref:Serpentine Receptor, class H n=1 Tax=Caenorhabditis elegans TaxID=6239 RepID=J7S134_CAEEL|nr:Serpentine Receptor, class H [Caenorhabditis elegans]CCM09393.1 Serpentine Receptor, class H [Caenorhabditis elegans]|eukprot:NP_001263783.1 Serpentine Receptor, class I [Caenorhabditis elegans]
MPRLRQILSLLADAQTTLLMQPVYILPIIGGYTNGLLWQVFRLSSHIQMAMFLLLLYLQVASIVCAIVTKYHVVSNIGKLSDRSILFWIFVIVYHGCAFVITGFFSVSCLARQEEENLIKTKFPNAISVFTLENVAIYDLQVNKWMMITTILFAFMLTSSIVISFYFSVRLLKTLPSKRNTISARSFRGHQIAVTSLMAQATVPFLVLIIPIGTIVYLFVHVLPNAQEISNIMMAVYSFHASLSTFVMIISTPQYRKMIRRGFRAQHPIISTQMTKVGPPSADISLRLKKLSAPEM